MSQSLKHPTLPKYYSTSRLLRNKAEKHRRDKMNYHVTELASLVPFVERAQKKVDKVSVLRLAASYIRMHRILKRTDKKSTFPTSLINAENSRSLLNSIGGFLLAVTNIGKVIYISEAIEDTFGFTQNDVIGQSLYSIIHEDDKKLVSHQLNSKSSTRKSFYCRMLEKSASRTDPERYEIIHIVGSIKPLPEFSKCGDESSMDLITSDREENSSDDEYDDRTLTSCENRTGTCMLVAFVQVVRDKPITDITWVESMRDEYITRHQMNGDISYVDHRISIITGLMPEEVIGKSAFYYMHQDDMLWSILAQKIMMESSDGQGVVTYRLSCKDGSFVFLHSRGFLEVNKETDKFDSFVCINTVVQLTDAEIEVQDQRNAYLPLLSAYPEALALTINEAIPLGLKKFMNPVTSQTFIHMKDEVEGITNGGSYFLHNEKNVKINEEPNHELFKSSEVFGSANHQTSDNISAYQRSSPVHESSQNIQMESANGDQLSFDVDSSFQGTKISEFSSLRLSDLIVSTSQVPSFPSEEVQRSVPYLSPSTSIEHSNYSSFSLEDFVMAPTPDESISNDK